ncbi:hypothetical protein Y1Q_0022122 [Alligator mississippiensis]|uniref:Uncharacterized protein n=1 Tax=Alligator mississippiensis TaxID=8496 RepID=A0A151P8E2_ALLMI|nr:hypothetical protein Y1Q_0022122 [Alligator mississippiensis]
MKAAAENPVYETMIMSDVPCQSCGKVWTGTTTEDCAEDTDRVTSLETFLLPGNLPESSPKRSCILYTLLLLLSLLLAASLGGVMAMYFQERQEKHRVAEAVQEIQDFWKENSTVNVSVLEQTGQQLVGEIQPLRGLWKEIFSPCAVLQEQYREYQRQELHSSLLGQRLK